MMHAVAGSALDREITGSVWFFDTAGGPAI